MKASHILIFLIFANILPAWFFQYFSSQDGPMHIAIAYYITNLWNGSCPNINTLFQFTQAPSPTWAAYIFIIPLLKIFPALLVEKIMFTIAVTAFSVAIYILLRTINKTNTWFIAPLLVLLPNYLLYMGGYNFILSLALSFLGISWWLKSGKIQNTKNLIIFTILQITLYFSHIFGAAVFVLAIAALELGDRGFKNIHKTAAYYFISSIPVMILFYLYSQTPKMPVEGSMGLAEKISYLLIPVLLHTLSKHDYTLIILTGIATWLLLALVLLNKRKTSSTKLYYLPIIFALALLLTPSSFGGGWIIEPRVELYFFITLLLWLSAYTYSNREKQIIIIVSLALTFFCQYNKFLELPKYSKTIGIFQTEKSYIPDNSTIFSVYLNPMVIDYQTGEENRNEPIPDLNGFLIANKSCIAEVSNRALAEINSFPATYKEQTNPHYKLGKLRNENGLTMMPPDVDIANYEKSTGAKIDYIIIHGRAENLFQYPKEYNLDSKARYEKLMRQVNTGFTLIHQSDDRSLNIYKRK